MEGGPFRPPLALERPKKPSINRVNKKIIRDKMKKIQAKKHKIVTYKINKISFSCFDDKRYVLDDGIYTLAYFHKDSITSCKKI